MYVKEDNYLEAFKSAKNLSDDFISYKEAWDSYVNHEDVESVSEYICMINKNIELKEEKGDMTLYYLDLLNIYDDACIKSLYLKKENINTYYYSDILFQKANCYYDSLINNLEKSEMFYTASAFRKNKQDFIQQYKILNKNL
jgi:hypothetical protein